MKPYQPWSRKGSLYETGARTNLPVPVRRPNKTAAGMSYTAARLAKPGQGRVAWATPRQMDVLRLVVMGTLDALRPVPTVAAICSCCGERTKHVRLDPKMRHRLLSARRRRAARAAS